MNLTLNETDTIQYVVVTNRFASIVIKNDSKDVTLRIELTRDQLNSIVEKFEEFKAVTGQN